MSDGRINEKKKNRNASSTLALSSFTRRNQKRLPKTRRLGILYTAIILNYAVKIKIKIFSAMKRTDGKLRKANHNNESLKPP